jgi:hypothetical protein
MKPLLIALISTTALCIAKPAHASHRHHHPFHRHHQAESTSKHYRHHARHHGARYAHQGSIRNSGRPSAWCGWWARLNLVGSDPGPEYNLARNWIHWVHAVSAQIGAMVVWSHHIGKITGGSPGHWIVTSGNDGHRVRSRERSVAGAIAFRMGS